MKPSNLEEINEAFTKQAPVFEANTYHLSKQEYLDYIVKKTAPALTDTILEVAAGTCVCGRSLAPHSKHVVCLDATPAMLEVGSSEAKKNGISNITFVKGYAENLPFLDRSFDIVISRLAFHHFADVKAAFSEMARVLKPRSKLIMIDMIAGDEALSDEVDRIEMLRDPSHIRNLSLSEMRALYEKNGLTLHIQEKTDIPVPLEAWMDLTQTPESIRDEIRSLMQRDLKGEYLTGFFPYQKERNIFFTHHWIFNCGYTSEG